MTISNGEKNRDNLKVLNTQEERYNHLVDELHLLLACYQLASADDKHVVWAVLNKYRDKI